MDLIFTRMDVHNLKAVIALNLGIVAVSIGCSGHQSNDMKAVLTSGQWVTDYSPDEKHVYTFHRNGTYQHKLQTDFPTPTNSGNWKLLSGTDGKITLQMKKNQGAMDVDWLGDISIVQYDSANDLLLISGKDLSGHQHLRHAKAN